MKEESKSLIMAHLSMFGACAGWGLMAPLAKAAMAGGLDGIGLVAFRVGGGALLFWIASFLCGNHEKVSRHDKLMLCAASLFGLVFNQCCYTIGLSITSPINASIVTTSMPIFTLILSAFILKDKITKRKLIGVALGCSGAVMLILTSGTAMNSKVGDIRGDLLALTAQCSYALYLTLFSKLIRRHNVITINKWMFLSASIAILPLAIPHMIDLPLQQMSATQWWEVAYVVVIGTFFCYILTMSAQKILTPTQVSVYNYVQPVISVIASLLIGIATLHVGHAIALSLVIVGVALVSKKKKNKKPTEKQGE